MKYLLVLVAIFFQACSDDASVNIFNKNITKTKLECMRLVVFPPNEMIESTLKSLYNFDSTCKTKLDVSFKSGITCNSSHNSDKKALSDFPSSYLKMQIMNPNLAYSYYLDLTHDVEPKDVQNAFKRIEKDLKL